MLFNYETSPLRSIWRMSLSGAGEEFLAYENSPVWSPDGSMIAFTGKVSSIASDSGLGDWGENEVWVMNADGSDPHVIGEYRWSDLVDECKRGLSWSANGTEVIFDGRSERVAAPADGSRPPVEIGIGCGPGTSPSGNASITEPPSDLLSGDRAIVHDPMGTEVMQLAGRGVQWSPDGTLIAYWTGGQVQVVDYPSGAKRATAGYLQFDEDLPELVWSPDGKWIAYARRGEIYVIGVYDSESTYQLSPGDDPTWSPDSRRIAFGFDNLTDGPGIYVTDAVYGAYKTRIADGISPAWSPDGSLILFTR